MSKGWPTTKDGSVDWDRVFTAPGTGFIPMVQQSTTPEQLKSCVHVIITSLFSRKDDRKFAEAYLATLDEMFINVFADSPEKHHEEARRRVINLLASIQFNRKKRAAEYQKLKAQGEERRLEADDPLAALAALETAE